MIETIDRNFDADDDINERVFLITVTIYGELIWFYRTYYAGFRLKFSLAKDLTQKMSCC